jgi:hypothetical protein
MKNLSDWRSNLLILTAQFRKCLNLVFAAAAMNTPPVCPKCGRTPAKVSERSASAGGTFLTPKKTDDNSLICTYRCECGTVFTRTEQRGDYDHGSSQTARKRDAC